MTITKLLLLTIAIATASCGGGMRDVPNPPSALEVSLLSGGAHLTWKDNSDNEAQFVIERKIGDAAFEVLDSVPFNTTTYHDAQVMSATTYTYRVAATPMSKEGGTTKYSNEASLTIP